MKKPGNLSWNEQSIFFDKNNFWLRKSQKLALKILTHIKRENISQKTLAERLDVSPQQVNKIVRGGANNMTLETICKIERELGVEFLIIPDATSYNSINVTISAKSLESPTHEQDAAEFFKANGAKIIALYPVTTVALNSQENTFDDYWLINSNN